MSAAADLALFYLDLLDALKLDQVHVAGHCIGGWTALELAVTGAGRFKSMVLLNSAGLRLKGMPNADMFVCSEEDRLKYLFVNGGSEWLNAERATAGHGRRLRREPRGGASSRAPRGYAASSLIADCTGSGCRPTSSGPMPSPVVTPAALSRRIKRAQDHDPRQRVRPSRASAERRRRHAMIDYITGDRLITGMVRGIGAEYFSTGNNAAFSHAQFRRRTTSSCRPGRFAFEGRFCHFKYVSMWPPPYQQPHPPIGASSTGSTKSIEWPRSHRGNTPTCRPTVRRSPSRATSTITGTRQLAVDCGAGLRGELDLPRAHAFAARKEMLQFRAPRPGRHPCRRSCSPALPMRRDHQCCRILSSDAASSCMGPGSLFDGGQTIN